MSGFGNREESMYKVYGHCCYPSCRVKKIRADEPIVVWDGVTLDRRIFEDELEPLAKLAVVANPTKHMELCGAYSISLELHPECAAEWGMQLIQDALKIKGTVGQTLRESIVKKEPEHGLCEQTPSV